MINNKIYNKKSLNKNNFHFIYTILSSAFHHEIWSIVFDIQYFRGRRGLDRMVVGFTTIYAISAYHHWCCEFESLSGRGVQHFVIKFVSGLVTDQWFSSGPPVSSSNKTDRYGINEILLKVVF
jgi:hypothetical protein